MTDLSPSRRTAAEMALNTFLGRVDAFCALSGRTQGPVSSALFGRSSKLAELRGSRRDVGVKRLAAAESALDKLAAEAGITLPLAPPLEHSGLSAPRQSREAGS